MSRRLALIVALAAALAAPAAAQPPAGSAVAPNPLLQAWTTPFGVPPFAEIKPEHFLPAIERGIAEQRREIDAIANDPQPATFANTILALDESGELLQKVSAVFSNLNSADTNAELQAINRQTTPLLSALRDDLRLNPKLFARVKAVWDARETLGLTPVQMRLLDNTYKSFVRSGANLSAGRPGEAPDDQRRAVDAGREVRREPAARHERLPARNRHGGRPRGPSAVGRRERRRHGEGGRPGRQVGLHAAGAEHLAVHDLRGQPRAAQADLHGLHDALRSQRRVRQQGRAREDGRPARRARAASGVPVVRRLRPGREHGEDAEGRLRPAEPALDAGARGRDEGSRRAAGADRPGRRRLQAGAVRLVVLHREGPQGALRSRRPGAAPVLPGREGARRDVLRREPALRPHVHAAARPARLQPRGVGLRGEGRRRHHARRVLHRLPPAARQARRRVDERLPRHARQGRQTGAADRDQRRQLLARLRAASRRCSASRRSRRSSTRPVTP